MDYTAAELNYLKYLLLSNYDESFTSEYIKKLKAAVFRFKKIGACEKKEIEFHGEKKYIPANGLRTMLYVENEENFEVLSLSIFQYLQLEINIKKKRLYKYNNISREKISATDISNFTFCPANFAISKTFSYKAMEGTVQGTEFHEKSILRYLINRVHSQAPKNLSKGKNGFSDFSSVRSEEAFIELRKIVENCRILYSGHTTDSEIFQSLKGNYVGKPDFILQEKNNGEIFVVEEKYRFRGYDKKERVFYQNHLNQTLSYICGIHEPSISFGILVYWEYEIDDAGEVFVCGCNWRKVLPNNKSRKEVNVIYSKIKQFYNSGILDFDPAERKPSKCANCVNNFLCGHKTGKLKTLSIPYKKEFIEVQDVKGFYNIQDEPSSELSYNEEMLLKLEEAKLILRQKERLRLSTASIEKRRPAPEEDV